MTQRNANDLERVQKSAVRIFGKLYESYTKALEELDMKRLSERRELICCQAIGIGTRPTVLHCQAPYTRL